jgi:hypothetical protein
VDLIQIGDQPTIYTILGQGFDFANFLRRGALIGKEIDENEFNEADCEGRA